ncbi:unnamed protein product [Pleuronectes platessa]|uniref:Uncharacterized protein n=1 Tax=Pleuronectes platessa TaxID=8262 RepID=A0A9N7ZCQ5_PLEPL|nr:unnamed protein product [Pleuronectes platessa]
MLNLEVPSEGPGPRAPATQPGPGVRSGDRPRGLEEHKASAHESSRGALPDSVAPAPWVHAVAPLGLQPSISLCLVTLVSASGGAPPPPIRAQQNRVSSLPSVSGKFSGNDMKTEEHKDKELLHILKVLLVGHRVPVISVGQLGSDLMIITSMHHRAEAGSPANIHITPLAPSAGGAWE